MRKLLFVCGHKRCAWVNTCAFAQVHCKTNNLVVVGNACFHVASALVFDEVEVHFGASVARGEGKRFVQNSAVFANDVVCGKNNLRSGFAWARRAVGVDAVCFGRLHFNNFFAEVGFIYSFVACRKVQNHVCTGKSVVVAWRRGRPHVLANFHSKAELFCKAVGKKQLRAKWDGFAKNGNGGVALRCAEPTFFVEFVVGWQVCFWHNAQNFALVQNCCNVEQLACVVGKWQTNHNNGVEVFQTVGNKMQRLQCGSAQCVLKEQISARVACQAQFGEKSNSNAVCVGFFCVRNNLFGIVSAVGNDNFGGNAGNFHQPKVGFGSCYFGSFFQKHVGGNVQSICKFLQFVCFDTKQCATHNFVYCSKGKSTLLSQLLESKFAFFFQLIKFQNGFFNIHVAPLCTILPSKCSFAKQF